jgi:hypothetical protein
VNKETLMESQTTQQPKVEKPAYEAPKLTVLGKVSQLTSEGDVSVALR